MPFTKVVSDEKILEQFERDDLVDMERDAYTYAEIAKGIDEVTDEAIRQRLKRMDGDEVESVEVGSVRLWYEPGTKVFADGASYLPLDVQADLEHFSRNKVVPLAFVTILTWVSYSVVLYFLLDFINVHSPFLHPWSTVLAVLIVVAWLLLWQPRFIPFHRFNAMLNGKSQPKDDTTGD